jgi:hypothetical protein
MMWEGSSPRRRVVADSQLGEGPTQRRVFLQEVGNFSEQVWGVSMSVVNGSVTGTGLLELSCEFHPGCGAVTRIMEANYCGGYDAEKRWMTGTVDFWSMGGEMTTWGTKGGMNAVSQCLDRTITEGEAWTTNWVLNVGEATPTGYQAAVIEGGDPAQRYGFFTLPLSVTTSQGDASALAEDSGESAVESAAVSGDEPASASRETHALLADGSGSIGMKALLLLLCFLVAGVGLAAAGIRIVIRLRMGFRR